MSAPLIAPSGPQETDNSNFGGQTAAQMANVAAATKMQPVAQAPINGAQAGSDTSLAGTKGYDVFGNAVKREPTVISSANITDNVIPNLHKQADALSQKGTTVAGDGKTYYADGSAVPAPIDAEYDATTGSWNSAGTNYSAAPQFIDNQDEDPQIANTNKLLSSMKASLDSTTLSQVNGIQKQFDMLRDSYAEANQRAGEALGAINQRTGTTRYAPFNSYSTALAQTHSGLMQIQRLDADEDAAIAKVRQAQQQGNYQLMEKALGVVDTIRTTKQTTAAKVAADLSAANAAQQKQKIQASRDGAIAGLIAQGITDPTKILGYLNKYDDGTSTGGDFTADEVKKALDNLKTTAAKDDAYKFDNTDVGTLLGSGLTMPAVQAIQDYYNGNGNEKVFDGLTDKQKAAVQTVLVGKVAAPKAAVDPDAFKFTPSQRSQLLSGNFTAADINAMQADVALHGIDAVIQGLPADQKDQAALVKRVLASSDTVAGVGSGVTLTRDSLSKLFQIPDNEEGKGYFGGETNKEKLDALYDFVERYRAVGYEDKDILKLIQDSQK